MQRYKHLPYKIEYALAEFIDNSIHSFEANAESLMKKFSREHCAVDIFWDSDKHELEIYDNAGGIHEDDFPRLVSIGKTKESADLQLSMYGMGMKTAALWMGDSFEVTTRFMDSEDIYNIAVDFTNLSDNGLPNVSLEVSKADNNSNQGWTKLTVKGVRRNMGKGKIPKKIKLALSNIYGQFIESERLKLKWSDGPISYEPWVLAKSPVDGAELKQTFSKDFGDGRVITGWIGMLEKGSSKYGGFSLYQNKRMVKGYPGERYKPISVFSGDGQGTNDLVNQRLVGRLNFNGFDVSHTKDNIDFAELAEEVDTWLGEECSIFKGQARTTKKSADKPTFAETVAVSEVKDFIENTENWSVESMEIQRSTDRRRVQKSKEEKEGKVKPVLILPLPSEHLFKNKIGVDNVEFYLTSHGYGLPYYNFEKRTEKRILVISVNTDSDYYEYVRERGQESIVALLLQSYFDVATLLWMQHDQTIQDTITDFALIKGKFLDMYAHHNSRS